MTRLKCWVVLRVMMIMLGVINRGQVTALPAVIVYILMVVLTVVWLRSSTVVWWRWRLRERGRRR